MDKGKLMGMLAALGLSVGAIFAGALIVPTNEGVINRTYLDPVGILTSCYGHTGPELKLGQTFTNEECIRQLGKDVARADRDVHSVIHVHLNWYEEAALIAFTYNVGVGNLRTSTLAKLFNAGQYEKGCKQMLRWVYAGGKKEPLPGLVKARQRETEVCLGNVTSVSGT